MAGITKSKTHAIYWALIFFNPSRESPRDKELRGRMYIDVGGKEGREKGDRYRAKRTLWLWNVIAGNKVPLESIVHSGKERGGWGASLRDAQQFRSRRYRDIKSDIFFVPAYITSIRDCLDVPVQIETVDRRDKAQESSRYRAIFVCMSCFLLVLYAICLICDEFNFGGLILDDSSLIREIR